MTTPEYKDKDEEVAVAPALAVEPEPEVEELKIVSPAPQVKATEPVKSKNPAPAAVPQVIPAAVKDVKVVSLSALKLNTNTTNSASVAFVQEQLIALGYSDAGSDNRGTFGENTRNALIKFCGCNNKESCSVSKEELIKRLFNGVSVQII